jgi:zinc/manganese transport system ATP-binding protein
MSLVRDWHVQGRTVIAALHDTDFIRRNFPETLLLARELIAWGSTGDVLTADNLARARMLNARWARSDATDQHHHHD